MSRANGRPAARWGAAPFVLAVALAASLLAGCASALKPLDTESDLARIDPARADAARAARLAAEAERLFGRRPDLAAVREAEDLWRRAALADSTSAAGVIGLARAQTWLARQLETPEARDAKASEAVATAQHCARREPESADCSYWLALAVGVQTEQRRVTAADGLRVMVDLLRQSIESREELDHAGPRRVLALVLTRAPGWPTGPGDPDEALVHARRAVERAPGYPPNLLALADAYEAVEEPGAARRHYREALEAARRWVEEGHPEAGDWVSDAEKGLG